MQFQKKKSRYIELKKEEKEMDKTDLAKIKSIHGRCNSNEIRTIFENEYKYYAWYNDEGSVETSDSFLDLVKGYLNLKESDFTKKNFPIIKAVKEKYSEMRNNIKNHKHENSSEEVLKLL